MSYHRPSELGAALDVLRQPGGTIIAGGTDVYPSSSPGHRPDYYLDVTALPGLSDITQDETGTRIGAAVSWTKLIQTPLPAAFDGLKEAGREVGSVQIQNAGTIAGNLCNASPAADGVPPLLTLDAQVEMVSAARGSRTLALSDFITGVRQTDLADDELLTAIHIPKQPNRATSAFEKLGSRRYLVISITMTAVVLECDASGRITHARVAVGACSPVAQRLHRLEQDMIGQHLRDIVVRPDHLSGLSPIDDVRGSGTFRMDAVQQQCLAALQRAGGHE